MVLTCRQPRELSAGLCCVSQEHLVELAGEMLLVSMSHVLKTELNLVLDSSWPLHPTSPCIISGTGLQAIS